MRQHAGIRPIKTYGERRSGKIPHNYVRVGEEQFDSQEEAEAWLAVH